MASCEKCWSDAHRGPQHSVVEEYDRLLRERKDNPCSPEEQAGPNAYNCARCDRKTMHQHAKVCMACGFEMKGHGGRESKCQR